MSFHWPLVLSALAVLPVLVALYIDRDRRRVAAQARFGNPDLLPNVVDREPGRLRYLPPLVLLVALVFMIVGVARPHATVRVPREEATIVLAMDVSRSMKATDIQPTRLDAARVAAKTFLDEVPDEVPRRRGVVRDESGRRRGAHRGPDAGDHRARHAEAGRGNRDRRRRRALASRRPAAWADRACRPGRSCSSPTARATGVRSILAMPRSRRSDAACRCTRSSSGPRTGSSRRS